MTLLPDPAEASNLPSRLHAKAVMDDGCPSSVVSCLPVATSQILMTAGNELESFNFAQATASVLPLGWNATFDTRLSLPSSNWRTSLPVATSRTRTVPHEAVATSLPSGAK